MENQNPLCSRISITLYSFFCSTTLFTPGFVLIKNFLFKLIFLKLPFLYKESPHFGQYWAIDLRSGLKIKGITKCCSFTRSWHFGLQFCSFFSFLKDFQKVFAPLIYIFDILHNQIISRWKSREVPLLSRQHGFYITAIEQKDKELFWQL